MVFIEQPVTLINNEIVLIKILSDAVSHLRFFSNHSIIHIAIIKNQILLIDIPNHKRVLLLLLLLLLFFILLIFVILVWILQIWS